MLNNKVVLITGGTGSFGKKFVEVILRDYPQVKKLIVYSRNEQNQLDMQTQFPDTTYPAMRRCGCDYSCCGYTECEHCDVQSG